MPSCTLRLHFSTPECPPQHGLILAHFHKWATVASRGYRALHKKGEGPKEAHWGPMAALRKGRGCGCSCRMRTQRQARVHHSRALPSALALATRPAFSIEDPNDLSCAADAAFAFACPLHSCSMTLKVLEGHRVAALFSPLTMQRVSLHQLRAESRCLLAGRPRPHQQGSHRSRSWSWSRAPKQADRDHSHNPAS